MSDFDSMISDVVSRCAAVQTLSTARSLTRHFDDVLRPVNLTITQFTLLVVISRIEPESISQIGAVLSMDRTSVSRNLRLLVNEGLIEVASETAARKRPVKISRKGRARLKKAYSFWRSAQEKVEENFTPGSYERAMRSLKTLRQKP